MSTPLPELLAPAGCWAALKAAAANGADAVYFGVEAFNARLRAENFRVSDLPAVMQWLHDRGLKGFLTVNVLVFADELEQAAQLLRAAHGAGVDAVIVQDIGLALLARELTPDLPVHGSTQMSITSAAGVAMAADLGCQRVVLARELSLRDLQRIQAQLLQRQLEMPLEVFVHGALCVAYSGQCLTSEALGQRSANRGECAQACRLPYQLIVDGEERDLGEQRYLLSPQDLSAWELLPQLQAAGVASLKIEGRLKEPAYVAAVTQAYRQGLERLRRSDPAQSSPVSVRGSLHSQLDADSRRAGDAELRHGLELSFSRGLSHGWLEGVNHRTLVHGRWSKKRGPWLGRLQAVEPSGWLLLSTHQPLKPGDGLVLEAPGHDPLLPPLEIGGRVMALEQRSAGVVALRLGPGRLALSSLRPGSPCWLTSDPHWEKRWSRQPAADPPPRRVPIRIKAEGTVGQPLRLTVESAMGLSGGPWVVESAEPLQPARQLGLDRLKLTQQLGRLGETSWQLEELHLDLQGEVFLPVAQLNALRRALIARLEQARPQPPAMAAVHTDGAVHLALGELQARLSQGSDLCDPGSASLELTVLVRSLDQLRALRDQPVHRVIAELEQPNQLRDAVAMGHGVWPGGLWLAGQRICRPDEQWTLDPLIQAKPDGYLVRNADQLERLTPLAPCQGDFSLNVANPLTALWLLQRWGLERVTASYDLALDQLLALVEGCPPARLEVTLHQHMPLFHMEHCLFCAFLSDGHDHTDCGRPCEQHTVLLRDRSGAEHPLRADLGCRNTVFNARAQTAVEMLPQLRRAGVRCVRLELLQEAPADAVRRVQLYRQVIAGAVPARQVWQQEQLESRLGVTRGTLLERHGSGAVGAGNAAEMRRQRIKPAPPGAAPQRRQRG